MRKILFILTLALAPLVARAGTIVGTVHAEGKAEAGENAQGGKYDSRRYKFVEKVNYSELDGFIVFIDQEVTNAPPVKPKTLQVITQKDACFHPHVLPLLAG